MDHLHFLTAGRAVFTIQSKASGNRFTYRVRRAKPTMFFVDLLTGPNNEQDYSYLGVLTGKPLQLRMTKRSTTHGGAPSVMALRWMLGMLQTPGRDFTQYATFHHEGKCGACGRALTVPESIESGLGPVCASRLGG